MRLLRIPVGSTSRLVRGYAAFATKSKPDFDAEVEPEAEHQPEAESSTAAQRRLWPAPPSAKPDKPTRLTLKADPKDAVKPKRRRAPNALALIRAQKLAQAIQDAEPASPAVIPPTTSPIPKPQAAPTLEDLEAMRPVKGPLHPLATRYPKAYQRLYNTLDGAFVAKQLMRLAREMGVRTPHGRGKGLAIKGIMAAWGWEPPIPPEVMEEAEDTQAVMERDWELRHGELWLMMKDAEGLRPIMEQGVRFSIPSPARIGDGATTSREGWRVLRGSGSETSLEEMDTFINERRAVRP